MKNQICELFGYEVEDKSEKAEYYRKNCICPFTNNLCDGGGNRYQTFLTKSDVEKNELTKYFSKDFKMIPPGVCSLSVKDVRWIVCPRRIFSFSNADKKNWFSDNFCGVSKKRVSIVL